jgi:hypothetical protein
MKKKLAISLVGLLIVSVLGVVAGEVADWSTGGGTAKIDESSGTITLTVDAVSSSAISGAATLAATAITATSVGSATVTASGAVQGATLGLSATQYFDIVSTTQLVFIAGAVTNVIDADITTP